jgi:methyl-accepting chemotaxis protein
MFATSLTRLLLVLQGLFVVALLTVAVIEAGAAWQRYGSAESTVRLAKADRAVFDGIIAVRDEIPKFQTALLSEDDPHGAIARTGAVAQQKFDAALAALAATPVADRAPLAEAARAAWSGMADRTAAIDAEADKPRSARDVARTADWRAAVLSTVDTLAAASTAISNRARLDDPLIAELVEVHRTAWTLRDSYGAQCSLLRPNVARSQPPSAATAGTWSAGKGVVKASLDSLSGLLDRPGAPAEVVARLGEAGTEIGAAQQQIDALVGSLDGSGHAAMDSKQFTEICDGPFKSILAIGYAALDGAVAEAERGAHRALVVLAGTSLGLAVTLLLTVVAGISIERRLRRPTGAVMAAIRQLASHDYRTPIPPLRHEDELGAMAKALEVLRLSALAAEELSHSASTAQKTDLARATAMASLCRDFDSSVGGRLSAIERSTEALNDIAKRMRAMATQSSDRAGTVATAADTAAVNVQTVATSAEELTQAIGEITRRMSEGADRARAAVDQTHQTHLVVEALSQAAQRIGAIVQLIDNIAGQTNLLALNATIEAARAGEAGKGFAVVATEVKALASQTAKATGEIAGQIQTIQATTGEAVAAIQTIGAMIGHISEGSAAVAAAVEQQGAATQAIAYSVQQVATSTQDVRDAVSALAEYSQATDRVAQDVFDTVGTVSSEESGLRGTVVAFLGRIQAA